MVAPLKGIGLNPNIHAHYTDHLAVVCYIMGVPLLFTDGEAAEQAKRDYPGLKAVAVDWNDVNPDYLVREYDVLFQCDLWPRLQLYSLLAPLEKKYQKQVRNVHCPHGFSDKIFWLQRVVEEDITLLYGPNMIDMLEEQGIWGNVNEYALTGNYRYSYYQKNRPFYEKLVEERVLCQFAEKRPLLFYAPTWNDPENSSSFPEAAKTLLKNVPKEWNLLVKLHPRIEENYPIEVDTLFHPYRNHPNIAFIDDFSLIYPLLAKVDVYIGDRSSIGYDFLPFRRPMFFLNHNTYDIRTDRRAYLLQCGTVIQRDEYPSIYSIIEKNLPDDEERFGRIRQDVYEYTFGEERSFAEIRNNIVAACQSPRPQISSFTERPLWRKP